MYLLYESVVFISNFYLVCIQRSVRLFEEHVDQHVDIISIYQQTEHFGARDDRRQGDVEIFGEFVGVVDIPNNIQELRHQKRVQ